MRLLAHTCTLARTYSSTYKHERCSHSPAHTHTPDTHTHNGVGLWGVLFSVSHDFESVLRLLNNIIQTEIGKKKKRESDRNRERKRVRMKPRKWLGRFSFLVYLIILFYFFVMDLRQMPCALALPVENRVQPVTIYKWTPKVPFLCSHWLHTVIGFSNEVLYLL